MNGAIHRKGKRFLKRLAARLATKWDMAYSGVLSFVSSTNANRNSSGIDPLHSGCQEKVLFADP